MTSENFHYRFGKLSHSHKSRRIGVVINMASKRTNLSYIVSNQFMVIILLIIKSATPEPRLLYCLYRDGATCAPNTFISNSSFSLDAPNAGLVTLRGRPENGINISCTASKPIRWILNVAPVSKEIPFDGADNGFAFRGHVLDNTTEFFLWLGLQSRVLDGVIRCETFENEMESAEMLLDSGRKTSATLIGQSDIVNFYIPQYGSELNVPCLATGTEESSKNSFKLFKTHRTNKVLNSLSDSCLKCICYPYGCSVATCPEGKSLCGPYKISSGYWLDGGQMIPENATIADGWRECSSDYTCATNTVIHYMGRFKRDCNGDGSITCEDFILIHRVGPTSCSIRTPLTELVLKQHGPCLESNYVGEEELDVDAYDPRMGFRSNGSVDFSALYVCSTSSRDQQLSYAPLDPERQVPSRIYYGNVIKPKSMSGIICEADDPEVSLQLLLTPCTSVTHCYIKYRPFAGLGRFVDEDLSQNLQMKIPTSESTQRVMRGLTMTEGMIGCFGVCQGNTTENPCFVRQIDHFFTGLDSNIYLTSSVIPASATMELYATATTFTEGFREIFSCRVSTFLLFPLFQFAIVYKSRIVQIVPMEVNSVGELQAENGEWELSRIFRDSGKAERLLHLTLTPDMVQVTCFSPHLNSTQWTNATVKFTVSKAVAGKRSRSSDITTASVSVVLLLAITAMILLTIKYLKAKKQLRALTEEEIEEFYHGNGDINATAESDIIDVNKLGFPAKYILPADSFEFREVDVIGEGQFGRCVKGTLHGRTVAVKMTKSKADVDHFKEFLKEIKIMAFIDKHENVVEFIGAVVDRIGERVCMAVIEFSSYGDLLQFLRRHSSHNASVKTSSLIVDAGSSCPGSSEEGLSELDMLRICTQIAAGMEHLSLKKVVHGDLAARNVLVFSDLVVKITDFGLSRKLYDCANYTKKTESPLPWRWMALESLKYFEFSYSSDVWSFGVTAWEVFSLGQVPFSGLTWTPEFVKHLEQDVRLSKPTRASLQLYEFMLGCWKANPADRPTITEVKDYFRGLLKLHDEGYYNVMATVKKD